LHQVNARSGISCFDLLQIRPTYPVALASSGLGLEKIHLDLAKTGTLKVILDLTFRAQQQEWLYCHLSVHHRSNFSQNG